MRRFLPRWWLGTLLLFPLLTSGCQHTRPCCANCAAPSAVAMGAPAAVAPNAVPVAAQKTAPPPGKTTPLVQTSAKPPSSFAADATPALGTHSPPSSRNLPQGSQVVPAVATGPNFGHDPNYRWLVGTLDYSRIQRGWLLRYTPIEEDDRYGGCVALVAPDREMHFKRGQTVRVEGALIDPESRQLRPAFRVQNVRVEKP